MHSLRALMLPRGTFLLMGNSLQQRAVYFTNWPFSLHWAQMGSPWGLLSPYPSVLTPSCAGATQCEHLIALLFSYGSPFRFFFHNRSSIYDDYETIKVKVKI